MTSGLGEICQVQQLGHADCQAASSRLLGLRRQKRELQWCCDEQTNGSIFLLTSATSARYTWQHNYETSTGRTYLKSIVVNSKNGYSAALHITSSFLHFNISHTTLVSDITLCSQSQLLLFLSMKHILLRIRWLDRFLPFDWGPPTRQRISLVTFRCFGKGMSIGNIQVNFLKVFDVRA